MDSFYEAPRQPPARPTISPIERIPVVPEVSIIENGLFQPLQNSNLREYNTSNKFINKENSFRQKQVRFRGAEKENVPLTLKGGPDLNGKTFKQIYMANVPDRHLDLSIFEPPRNNVNTCTNNGFQVNERICEVREEFKSPLTNKWSKNKAPSSPLCPKSTNSMTKFNEERFRPNMYNEIQNLSVSKSKYTTVFNEKQNSTVGTKTKCTEISTQTEPVSDLTTPSNEPTIKDLFRIIQQQNEQIMLLQQQVNNIKTTVKQPEIDNGCSPSKKNLFSFDVKATSFEFSFRPQQKFRNFEPKIQEIMECDDSAENQSNSFHLDSSLDVKNSYVSNNPSIAIEMDEYRSSDEDEEPEIGLSFYKDLMNQVNNALKQARKQSECQTPVVAPNQPMAAVKQATLQHLKNIGINLSPIQESSEAASGGGVNWTDYEDSDVSCAVQQLLMKYLPSDKLAKVMNKPKISPQKNKERKLGPSSDLSFATMQYMKKYNLLGNNTKNRRLPEGVPKILDVTALKLQPKLL